MSVQTVRFLFCALLLEVAVAGRLISLRTTQVIECPSYTPPPGQSSATAIYGKQVCSTCCAEVFDADALSGLCKDLILDTYSGVVVRLQIMVDSFSGGVSLYSSRSGASTCNIGERLLTKNLDRDAGLQMTFSLDSCSGGGSCYYINANPLTSTGGPINCIFKDTSSPTCGPLPKTCDGTSPAPTRADC